MSRQRQPWLGRRAGCAQCANIGNLAMDTLANCISPALFSASAMLEVFVAPSFTAANNVVASSLAIASVITEIFTCTSAR